MSLKQSQANIAEINANIETAKLTRNGPNRTSNLKKLDALKARESAVNAQLESLKFNDPAEVKKVKDQMEDNIQAVNRWTDNIWTIKSYLVKKKGMSGKE
eukprot:gene41453-51329_t